MLIYYYYINRHSPRCAHSDALNNFLVCKEYERKKLNRDFYREKSFRAIFRVKTSSLKDFPRKVIFLFFVVFTVEKEINVFSEESRINHNHSRSRTVREMFSSRHNIIKLCPIRQLDEFVYETSCFRVEIPIRNFKHVSSANTRPASGEIIIVERYLHRTNKIRIREVALDR